ncbi:uracil phosphoribosyltransferase-domain-containing protein [Lactarius vividus]|nr:uracil phosphoribosyltransferase-domain-containing protein [Lactarius vividus]
MTSSTTLTNHSAPNTKSDIPSSVFTLRHTAQLEALYTIIRDKNTSRGDFIFIQTVVETPTGANYEGVRFEGKICGVSILRAGEAMEQGLREVCRSVRIGKILIQRDEETTRPKLFYSKLPQDIAQRYVLLLDPMLATGGSAMKAVEVIMEHGVPEDRIIFINLVRVPFRGIERSEISNVGGVKVSSPQGLRTFATRYPSLKVVTGWIDEGLNERAYIVPGLGDFGERRYCA